MQDRPQHPVGEAVVEFLVVVLAQVDGDVGSVVLIDALGRPLASATRPLQPNQRPPRRRSAARIATSRPPARALPSGTPTRLETTTSRDNIDSPQIGDAAFAGKIIPGIAVARRIAARSYAFAQPAVEKFARIRRKRQIKTTP